jgi:hypothetical protein
MVLDIVVGGALVAMFTASLITQASSRAANRTLDFAVEEVDRVVSALKGEMKEDPETKFVLRVLTSLDLENKIKLTNLLLQQMKGDEGSFTTIKECSEQIENKIVEIEEILRDIKVELFEHSQLYLHEYRFSNVRPMLDTLKTKINTLDYKVDLIIKLKLCTKLYISTRM